MSTRLVAGQGVFVIDGSTRDDEHARLLLGHEKGASRLVGGRHVGNDGAIGVGYRAGLGVVGPRINFGRRRGVESLAVIGEGEAMVQLQRRVSRRPYSRCVLSHCRRLCSVSIGLPRCC